MINVAVGWLLYERTGDPWSLGLVGAASWRRCCFLMVAAGNAADRYPRRNIGIFAHSLLTAAAAGLALVSWLDGPTWVIYSLLALVGTARAFASPSVNTILPQLLAPAEFANANAWLSSTFQLAAITGPAVGGMLIAATGGATVAFALGGCRPAVFVADAAHDAGAPAAAGSATAQRAATCLRASASCARTRCSWRRSRSTCSRCCSAARWRCCRSSRKTSCRSGPPVSAGCARRRASAR